MSAENENKIYNPKKIKEEFEKYWSDFTEGSE
jgi:hypothetical protein